MKEVAILQSNYIPWKGYFDIINMVDEFILYDDMQYTKRDWRNRNKIKTGRGVQWLTIPVETKGKFHQKINETVIAGDEWASEHWKAIIANYGKAPYFKLYSSRFERLYSQVKEERFLSMVNFRFIKEICDILQISTKISWSSDYELRNGKTERLVGLCEEAGGAVYLSGPAAKDYIVNNCFTEAGITLKYMDYTGYPQYTQLYGDFIHEVTVLDLIFNEGPKSREYMKSFN